MDDDLVGEFFDDDDDYFVLFEPLDDGGWHFVVEDHRVPLDNNGGHFHGTASTVDEALPLIRQAIAERCDIDPATVEVYISAIVGEVHVRMLDGMLSIGRELRRRPPRHKHRLNPRALRPNRDEAPRSGK